MKEATIPKFNIFAKITRVDKELRIVEGYCFVNEEVGDGFRLTRGAMEDAAEAYMKFPAIREMHGRNAAGKATAITFDEKGCFIRALIVDDQAWEKVKANVYTGFSVGINPRIVRGKDVIAVDWIENSLVDRPKDPEAVFTVFRSDAAPGKQFELEADEDLFSILERVSKAEADAPKPKTPEERITELEAKITRLEKQDDPNQQRPHMSRLSIGDGDHADVQRTADEAELKKLTAEDYTNATKEEKNAAVLHVQQLKGTLFSVA